jgi:hypothetical protein
MSIARTSPALFLATVALGCGARPPTPAPAPAPAETPDAAAPAPDMDVYWANVALVRDRYCMPLAVLSSRVLDACGCSSDARESGLLSIEELAASCSYHLVLADIPDDRSIQVDEPALATCINALDVLLTGCVEARLPVVCELSRLFDPAPGALAYTRPEGSDCRAENGDESFDAHFLCAEGLTCAGTCTRAPSDATDGLGACIRPLGLPPAIP